LPTDSGDFWIGTQNSGVFRSSQRVGSPASLSLERIDLGDDYKSLSVYSIQEARPGVIWLTSSNGLYRLDMATGAVTRFDSSDGLQGSDFNFGAAAIDESGNLLIGGGNGYNRFDPDKVIKSARNSEVRITNIALSGNELELPVPSYLLEEIHLNHNDDSISFEFSVLDFLSPSKNRYRYMLEGFDESWVESGTRNYTTYTNLPAGQYKLRVQGANSSGIWNRDGASLVITKNAAPWLRWWAWLAYLSAFLFVAWMYRKHLEQVIIAREAEARASQMHEAADAAIDELHEQLDYQRDLVATAKRHSIQTLDLINEFVAAPSDTARERQLSALRLLETHLLYQDEALLADMRPYVEDLTQLLLPEAAVDKETITIINNVKSRYLPMDIASPLAILLTELLSDVLRNRFRSDSPANYVQIDLSLSLDDQNLKRVYRLCVSDNGNSRDSLAKLSTEGQMQLVVEIAKHMEWQLECPDAGGTEVCVSIPDTWDG
ncbi:MAG: triple tyrosine motif-containing protein, partial [Pseudomonadota bacterium]